MEGAQEPAEITLAELKTLGLETVATVLQCSGNGRVLPHQAQWHALTVVPPVRGVERRARALTWWPPWAAVGQWHGFT